MLNSIITPKGNISVKAYREYLQYNIDLYNNNSKITKVLIHKGFLSISISYDLENSQLISVPIGISYLRNTKSVYFHKKNNTIEVSFLIDRETILMEDKIIDFLNRTKK